LKSLRLREEFGKLRGMGGGAEGPQKTPKMKHHALYSLTIEVNKCSEEKDRRHPRGLKKIMERGQRKGEEQNNTHLIAEMEFFPSPQLE